MVVVDGVGKGPLDEAALAAELRARLTPEPGLRVVAHYAPERADTVFVREDVRRRFTDREMRKPIKDAVLDSLATSSLESLFEDAHVGTVRVFEKKRIVYCPVDDARGVIVSLDPDAETDAAGVLEAFQALAVDP